jgi:phosphate transport system protein
MENTHIVARFDKKLDQIRDLILEMGALTGVQIKGASAMLDLFDPDQAAQIISTDRKINSMNKDVHKKAERLIALRQPVALDLRQALLPINIAGELERIGDHAKSTTKRARILADAPRDLATLPQLQKMSRLVQAMLSDVLNAYQDTDIELAAEIRIRDREVDSLNKALFDMAMQSSRKNPELAEPYVHTILLARNFERAGDHVVNIARHVHQIATGEDLKASQ